MSGSEITKMKLDFYHWAVCPLNSEMLELLQAYDHRLEIHTHDLAERPGLAGVLGMFYPTLTMVNDCHRYFAPLRREFLEQLCCGQLPPVRPYRPVLGRIPVTETVLPMTEENVALAGHCVGHENCPGCRQKAALLREMGLSVYGFLHVRGNQLLGGAEYIPSVHVPYGIPRDPGKAFLTCVYLSDETYDYKSAPLAALEAYLAEQYESVLVISDETGVFPNGDLAFFRQRGYQDLGVVAEEGAYCRLHLLEKYLPTKSMAICPLL